MEKNNNENEQQSWNRHWGKPTIINKFKKINMAYPEIIKTLLELSSPDAQCLELGCGSGTYAIELLLKKRQCLASDYSQKALAMAQIKGRKLYHIDVPTQLIDIYNIPYPDNTFDLVFSNGLLEHLDILKALAEMKRVLKPSGWMVAEVSSNKLLFKLVYKLISFTENQPDEAWLPKEQWKKMLVETGYKNVEVSDCASILHGFMMRMLKTKKYNQLIPSWGKIYFLTKAQK